MGGLFGTVSDVASDCVFYAKAAGKDISSALERAAGEIASIPQSLGQSFVYYSERDESSNNNRRVTVELNEIYESIMVNLGIADGNSPKYPAGDAAIAQIQETELNESDYTYQNIDESASNMKKEPPSCSI